jgi:PTS system N-acetylglucosamine-specific IIC component
MGISMFITDSLGVLHGFTFSGGAIDYLINFKLATKPTLILLIGLGIGCAYFFIFYTLIVKLNLPTPGREQDEEFTKNVVEKGSDEEVAKSYIEFLGGQENISKVDNCATRLRLEVKDASKIDEKGLKSVGARGVIKLNNTSVQVIVGTNVEFVADGMKSLIK